MGKFFKVNLDYLPIKLHYLFFLGGMGGYAPYMPVFAKGLGINATAVGLIFTTAQFCTIFSKPLFGFVTDYLKSVRTIIFILTVITIISCMLILFIPHIENTNNLIIKKPVSNDVYNLALFPLKYNETCFETIESEDGHYELQYKCCEDDRTMSVTGIVNEINNENKTSNFSSNNRCIDNTQPSSFHFLINSSNTDTICDCIDNFAFGQKSKPNLTSCFCGIKYVFSIYTKYQFWLFYMLSVLGGIASNTALCLSDTACYELLGDKPQLYGRQRLFGTVGWGITTLFTGLLSDIFTGSSNNKNYAPGFYVMLTLATIDLVWILKFKNTQTNNSSNICKDVKIVFASYRTVVFAVSVTIIGVFASFISFYLYWFLQELGAPQTLLGLTTAVQCLCAEFPIFFVSGWFVRTFGPFYSLMVVFTAFALRFGLYFFIVNPWYVLPIELFHGITFAIFHTTMTSYASFNARSGTEATTMGILGGLYDIGVAVGSLLCGVGFDKLGGSYTFLLAGAISMLCVPILLFSRLFMNENINVNKSSYTDSNTINEEMTHASENKYL